jgi:two-component system, chemotaxis family, protein-glutamate methylesterase/glutaminase
MSQKIKVLIVDDSALIRNLLEKGLSRDPMIEVIGKAPDVFIARDKIVSGKPDVITLDVELPGMNGVDFLKKFMPQYPLPVIMVSGMTDRSSSVTLDALEAGAVDFVMKPSTGIANDLDVMMKELIEKVKIASKIDVSGWRKEKRIAGRDIVNKKKDNYNKYDKDRIIAIGASTGGTVALEYIISDFPADSPGTVVVQHMPPVFTKMFAERLDKSSMVTVKEAENGDIVEPGRVLIAPGGYQMVIAKNGNKYVVFCKPGENVNGHCPSVDVLFDSVAKNAGENAIGVMLTGMGKDGAMGMLNMRRRGARTIAQDEESCVVFGMPKEAYEIGGAEKLVNLKFISVEIQKLLKER